MIIICDDASFAQSMFEEVLTWNAIKTSALARAINIPLDYMFSGNNIYQGNVENEQRWQYLLVVKFAHTSQFEILCKLCRDNKLNVGNILCLAGSGRNFRGFKNRSWQSIPGNLHLSAYIAPHKAVAHFHVGFILMAVNAAVQTLNAIKGIESSASIKWVNDILIEKRKVGGILVQTQAQGNMVIGAVLGIGINVEQTPAIVPDVFVPQVGCLWDFSQKRDPLMKVHILKGLLDNLYKNYQKLLSGNYKDLFNFYNKHSSILGKEVTLYSDPYKGSPRLMLQGKVERIGMDLELYFKGIKDPVYSGRLAFTT